MPRHYGNYQPAADRDTMPHDVYMQVVYILKDYNRMLNERNNILHGTAAQDGTPRGPGVGDPTGSRAMRLAALSERVDGIDAAIHDMNALYNQKIKRDDIAGFDSMAAFDDCWYFCYALQNPENGKEPVQRTWKRFRRAFAHKIAENLKLI